MGDYFEANGFSAEIYDTYMAYVMAIGDRRTSPKGRGAYSSGLGG